MAVKVGLDFGYANTVITDSPSHLRREPSVLLTDKTSGRILAVGAEVFEGKENGESEAGVIVRPLRNGLLYAPEMTRAMVDYALRLLPPSEQMRCLVALPSDFPAKQEKALYEMLKQAGVKEVYGVSRSLAALIGAGYAPTISVISVNVGAGATDVTVLHRGNILFSATESVGGEDFDRAVKDYIAEQGSVSVSLRVAQMIKEKLGAVWPGRENESITIDGVMSLTGNRVSMTVSTEDILSVFEKPLAAILKAVADLVEKIPVSAVEDIFRNGIILSGGGAELFGIEKMMEQVFSITVTKAVLPMDCVAKGLSRIQTFLPIRNKGDEKNVTAMLADYYETKMKTNK